jgi:hypothetical protein
MNDDFDDYEDEINDSLDMSENDKKYIVKLKGYKFPDEVTSWVENEIYNVKRRVHNYNDEVISAYIILAHIALNIPYVIEEILDVIGTTKKKKNIMDLISGTSTKNSPIQESSISVPIIVVSPVKFIRTVLDLYLKKNYSNMDIQFSQIYNDIEHYTNIMCLSDETFLNMDPKSSAAAFVYFYIIKFSGNLNTGKKSIVVKTNFKTLKFGPSSKQGINQKSFDECYKRNEILFNKYAETATQEEINMLILS